MSERKYERGAKMKTIGQFATCGAKLYIVKYDNGEKTTHKGWLGSWQFRYLNDMIKAGRIFVAREIKKAND